MQGRLPTAGGKAPIKGHENAPAATRGMACLIGDGPDFFIAVGDHGEWGHAHTVFGLVDDDSMRVVDAITRLPVQEQTWGQTHVTSLVRPLDYELELLP